MAPRSRKQRYNIFASGELIYLIEHQERLDTGQVLSQLAESSVMRGLGEMGLTALRNADVERVLSLERPDSSGFNSLVFLTVTEEGIPLTQGGIPVSDEALLEMVYNSDRLIERSYRRKRADQRRWTGYSDFFREEDGKPVWKMGSREVASFAVRAVCPNWLFAATPPIAGGTGGPGGRPVPLNAPAVPLTLPVQAQIAGEHCPVEVAILDTAPSPKQLKEGYDQFVTNGSPRNELLANLLGQTSFQLPNSVLRISYDATARYGAPFMQTSIQGRERLYIEDHDYVMNDHGTFIAGIIYELTHSKASSYKKDSDISLHLIQVLNDYGIGSLETIARGLLAAWNSKSKDAVLVINCSFMLPVPRHRSHRTPRGDSSFSRAWKQIQAKGKNELKDSPAYAERWTWIIDYLCSLLRVQGVTIVAAAGNDARDVPGTPRPGARFPAAFRSVVGVSALDKRGQTTTASYSNQADNPLRDGFATFGGFKDSNGFTDTREGVPGVYIGSFPALATSLPPDNKTGFAMWAGTSFAAPIISAALALERANGADADQAVDSLHLAAQSTGGVSVIPIP